MNAEKINIDSRNGLPLYLPLSSHNGTRILYDYTPSSRKRCGYSIILLSLLQSHTPILLHFANIPGKLTSLPNSDRLSYHCPHTAYLTLLYILDYIVRLHALFLFQYFSSSRLLDPALEMYVETLAELAIARPTSHCGLVAEALEGLTSLCKTLAVGRMGCSFRKEVGGLQYMELTLRSCVALYSQAVGATASYSKSTCEGWKLELVMFVSFSPIMRRQNYTLFLIRNESRFHNTAMN
ncbi:uncharacterized protein BDR25DRAFT_351585 [Lindgomyces ingoldianus]|uniref:Uncharacterized protein n=1 Tax=Lindgomyces ingoldianus TaxID=673940 RepID=A0ACB6R5D5_9PLEO|nr:uncharacterized protein BDR25DRAFT_351585 [Lindgomyces ingoldianus]KAF2474053.1 hypothetical protein BDR25DRAFT_351585 [Lindgomyces ingoldianus]